MTALPKIDPKKTAAPWRPKDGGTQYEHLAPTERAVMTPLLAERMKQYDIVLPRARPVYDRVFIYPLADKAQDETYAGTSIIKPGTARDRFGASRGIVVKAGLGALEIMWSHGYEIGHVVLFARLSPWERAYEGRGREHRVTILHAPEIVGSEDLEDDVLEGHAEIELLADGTVALKDRRRVDPPKDTETI